jgi:integrase
VTITDTKNGDPLTLPMSTYLLDLLKRRHRAAAGDNPWVFPSRKGKSPHIAEPRFIADRLAELSGVKHTIHDLRRTFVTMAERTVPHAAVKALVNHRDQRKGGDITLGYTVFGSEELRPYMQKITDAFRAHAQPQ